DARTCDPAHRLGIGAPRACACSFLAAQAERPILSGVINIPGPGDAAAGLRCEIAADAVVRLRPRRHHRELTGGGFLAEVANKLVDYGRRRTVDRLDRNGRAAQVSDRR